MLLEYLAPCSSNTTNSFIYCFTGVDNVCDVESDGGDVVLFFCLNVVGVRGFYIFFFVGGDAYVLSEEMRRGGTEQSRK